MKLIKIKELVHKKIKIFISQIEQEASVKLLYKEQLFNDFLEVICSENHLFVNEINAAKKDFRLIQNEPETYLKKLIENGYIDREDYDVSEQFLYYNLLADYVFRFQDDVWRFDIERLSKFIAEGINLPFEITFNESDNDLKKVIEKLETYSAYTLLNIEGKMDSYNLFLCKKKDKEKILELAQTLDLPIEDL